MASSPPAAAISVAFRSLTAAIVVSTSLSIFSRTSNSVANTADGGFLHLILNVRSINISEIALDFNPRMRA